MWLEKSYHRTKYLEGGREVGGGVSEYTLSILAGNSLDFQNFKCLQIFYLWIKPLSVGMDFPKKVRTINSDFLIYYFPFWEVLSRWVG